MPPFHFPGFPAYLDAAAEELQLPEAVAPARRDATLAAVATLCAQAAEAAPAHVPGILAEARAVGDRLRLALRASELMLADATAGLTPSSPEAPARGPRRALRSPNP